MQGELSLKIYVFLLLYGSTTYTLDAHMDFQEHMHRHTFSMHKQFEHLDASGVALCMKDVEAVKINMFYDSYLLGLGIGNGILVLTKLLAEMNIR